MNNDQVSTAVLFFLGLAICLTSVPYGLGAPSAPGPGFVPFLLGITAMLLSTVGFSNATRKKKQGNQWSNPLRDRRWRNPSIIWLSLIIYGALLVPLGFLLCTMIFMAFLFRAISPQRWHWVIGGAIATAIISYLVFDVWLKAQLPKGYLGI